MSYAQLLEKRKQAKELAQVFERQGGQIPAVSDFDPNNGPSMQAPAIGPTPGKPEADTFPGLGRRAPSAQDLGPITRPATPPPPMELTAGYRNEYGTNVGVSYDPMRRDANVRAGFPIGDHQSGWNTSMRAGFNPEQGAYGLMTIGKRNIPQPETQVPAGQDEALMQVLNQYPEAAEKYRALQKRAAVDRAMGIGVPGSEKFSFYAGMNTSPDEDPRARQGRMVSPGDGMGGLPPGFGGIPTGYRGPRPAGGF